MSERTNKEQEVYELDTNIQLRKFIRFLISDQAFDRDFLFTAILEYYVNNKPSEPIPTKESE